VAGEVKERAQETTRATEATAGSAEIAANITGVASGAASASRESLLAVALGC
jgi:hypothetical protein